MSHTYKDTKYCNTNYNLNKEIHLNLQGNDQAHHIFLYKKFRSIITKTSCFENVKQVLVGLSGGVDSAVLLHMLCEYEKNENGPKVFALHIQHKQRGEESVYDENIAREIAAHVGCPFDVISLEDVKVGASEEQLRTHRHQALKNFAAKNKFERIALGHHMNDQAETFLFRLIRGADIKGLSSMKPFGAPYVRPLLEISRNDIEREAENCKLPFVKDSSNSFNAPARNFLRNVVIPSLQAKLDPQVVSLIFAMASSMSELDSYLSCQAVEMIKEVKLEEHAYSVKKLQTIHPALRKKMIHLMYAYIIKDKGSLSRDQIEMIDQWMETSQSPKFLLLPSNIRVEKKQGVLTFSLVAA